MPEKPMAAVAVAFAVGILVADYLPLAGCTLLVGSALFAGFLVSPPRFRATLVLIALVVMGGAWRYAAARSVAPDDISRIAFHGGSNPFRTTMSIIASILRS